MPSPTGRICHRASGCAVSGYDPDMRLDKGDRVISVRGIGGLVFSKVPKGTKGVVTSVHGMGGRYEVDFENGVTEDHLTEDDIAKTNR